MWRSGGLARFGLTEPLPDHCSLTRIRQRWGAAQFRRIFERTVVACVAAGIAKGEVVHVDATLIRADVRWEARAQGWVTTLDAENEPVDEAARDGTQTGKSKEVCTTDPDATMATTGRQQRLEPAYKQHSAVCGQAGVIVEVAATTGELIPACRRFHPRQAGMMGFSRARPPHQPRARYPAAKGRTFGSRVSTRAASSWPQSRVSRR